MTEVLHGYVITKTLGISSKVYLSICPSVYLSIHVCLHIYIYIYAHIDIGSRRICVINKSQLPAAGKQRQALCCQLGLRPSYLGSGLCFLRPLEKDWGQELLLGSKMIQGIWDLSIFLQAGQKGQGCFAW